MCPKIDPRVGPQASLVPRLSGVMRLGADSATSHDCTPLEPGNEASKTGCYVEGKES